MRAQDAFSGREQGRTDGCGHGHDDLAGKLEHCGRVLGQLAGRCRGQRRILRILQEQGPTSQKDLQDALGIQSGSMSEIAAKLENRGLIVRDRDMADKRKITLSITGEGKEWMVRRDAAGVRQRRAALFSALTEEERAALETMLDKLSADWEQRLEPERRDRDEQ